MTFRWVVQWARKKARMRTENRGLATEAIGVYRWREDETKAGCRRAEVGKRKKRERNRERETERERKKERREVVMMILWRKQTRIVYSKYTSNYGLNTRIAPDKKF